MNCINCNCFIQEGEGVSSCLFCDIANEPVPPIHLLKATQLEQNAIFAMEDGESWPIVVNGNYGKIDRKDGKYILSLGSEIVYESAIYNHEHACAYATSFSLMKNAAKNLKELLKSC